MIEEEVWLELLKQCRGKYRAANEILRLTREMGEALSRDDRISAQMQLAMRQDEIDQIQKHEEKICILLDAYPQLSARARSVMDGRYELDRCKCDEERETARTSQDLRNVVGRILELDKAISKRVAGKDSFYEETSNG